MACMVFTLFPTAVHAEDPAVVFPNLYLNATYDESTDQVTLVLSCSDYAYFSGGNFSISYPNSLVETCGADFDENSATLINDNPGNGFSYVMNDNTTNIGFQIVTKNAKVGSTGKGSDLVTMKFPVKNGQVGKTSFSFGSTFKLVCMTSIENIVSSTTNTDGKSTAEVTISRTISTPIVLTGSVATPAKLQPDTSATLTATNHVTPTLTWSPVLTGGQFLASTAYTATITLTPDAYYSIGSAATVTYADTGFVFAKDANGNFVASKTFPKTAEKVLSAIEVTKNPKTAYTVGDAFDPTGMVVKATYDDGSVDNNFTDYTVSYGTDSKSFKIGDTAVTLTSKTGSKKATVSVTVSRKTVTDAATAFAFTDPKLSYTGQDQASKIAVTKKDANLGTVTYKYQIKKNGTFVDTDQVKDAGEYQILAMIPEGSVYAAQTVTAGTFTVAPKQLSASDFNEIPAQTYNGTELQPSVTSGSLTANDYEVTSYANNKNAGEKTASVTLTGKNNYTGTAELKFTINPITLTAANLAYTGTALTKTYDGTTSSEITSVSATSGLAAGDTFTAAGKAVYDSKDVGTGKEITFTPNAVTTGNYRLAATEIVAISNGAITASTALTDGTPKSSADSRLMVARVSGAFVEPVINGVNGEKATGTITYKYNGAAATYDQIKKALQGLNNGDKTQVEYTFTANGNYTGTVSGTLYLQVNDILFTVSGKTATQENAVTVKADPVYGDSWDKIITINSGIKAQVGSADDGGKGAYKLANTGAPESGEQKFTVLYTGLIDGNQYTDVPVINGTVTIAKKTLTADDLEYTDVITKVYDGTTASDLKSVSVKKSALIGTDQVTVNGTAAYNSKDVSAAKNVTFTTDGTLSGNTNYAIARNLTKEFPATITKKNIEIAISDIGSVDYTGKALTPAFTVTNSTDSKALDKAEYQFEYSNNTDASDKAAVKVSSVDGGNYSFAATTKNFVINKISYTGAKEKSVDVIYGNSDTLDLTTIADLAGTKYGSVAVSGDPVLDGTPSVSGSTLSYAAVNSSALIGKKAVITIPVSETTNYLPFDLKVTVNVTDKMEQPDFNLPTESQSGTAGYNKGAMNFPALKVAGDAPVTYSSSDPDVASIDEKGVITFHKYSTTPVVFTATASSTGKYLEAKTTYSLTITKSKVTVQPSDYTVTAGTAMPTLHYTYVGLKEGERGDLVIRQTAGTDKLKVVDSKGNTVENTNMPGVYKVVFVDDVAFEADNYDVVAGEGTFTVNSRPSANVNTNPDRNRSYCITYLDYNGNTVSVQWVKYGGSATAPAGYNYPAVTNVSANMDVRPLGGKANSKYIIPNTADRG